MARKAYQVRTDGKTRKLNWRSCLRGFLHGRMPQSIPSLEYKSFINSYYIPRFTTVTTEKQNHKSLMKNAAYAGIPWRMCSTFYLAVVHWHRLRTYRDLTMVSRSYSLKSLDLKISLLKLNSSSDKSHPSRCMRMSMRPPSRTSHYSLTKREKANRIDATIIDKTSKQLK